MDSALLQLKTQIERATRPEDFFGLALFSGLDPLKALKSLYKAAAIICHEDKHAGDPTDLAVARAIFPKLQAFYATAQRRIEDGTYGRTPVIQVRSKTDVYDLMTVLGYGDVSTVYAGTALKDIPIVAKVSAHPTCNAFLSNEVAKLAQVRADSPSAHPYFPRLVETVLVAASRQARTVNIFAATPGYVPLTQVLADYPEGVDPKHFVWIFKRLLTAIGYAQRAGIVHGAITPSNVLINPKIHGIMLIDWCFSTTGTPITALAKNYKAWYPPEVLAKRAVETTCDLYMAAECMEYVLGTDPGTGLRSQGLDARFRRLLDACLIGNPARRAHVAFDVYDLVTDAAARVYGPPKFVNLELTGA